MSRNLIRSVARSATMAVIIAVPMSIVFAFEGWTQTW